MQSQKIWHSWNGNISHPYSDYCEPRTEAEIAAIVAAAPARVRVIGTGRSSADIVGGAETLISLTNYNRVVAVERETLQITVESGITLKALVAQLAELGWCLPSLPDIDCITLGGALATGTHGTGHDAQLLSNTVTAATLIDARGEVIGIAQGSELLDALRVSLGTLGIISTVTLQCMPLFKLHIYEAPQRDDQWLANFETMIKEHDFLRILWLPHTGYGYVIRGQRCSDDTPVPLQREPWHHRYRRSLSVLLYRVSWRWPRLIVLANKILYRLFFTSRQEKVGSLYETTVTKSRGSTLELAEWTIPLQKFPALFEELRSELNSHANPAFAHIPMDIRHIRADKSWLSYAYGVDTITVGCVSRLANRAKNYAAFQKIEEIFLKYGGRPHWAKRHTLTATELATLYPHWNDFITLRRKMDPTGKFLTPTLSSLFETP